MSGVALVYCPFPDADIAHSAARTLVTERLAACANILSPCLSLYEWNGALEESSEVPVLFKTTQASAPALMTRIAELHPYEVPAIVRWDARDAFPPFLAWVAGQVK